MRLLILEQVLTLQKHIIEQSGGATSVRDQGILVSALAQPYMSYAGIEVTLLMTGYEIQADVENQETVILSNGN